MSSYLSPEAAQTKPNLGEHIALMEETNRMLKEGKRYFSPDNFSPKLRQYWMSVGYDLRTAGWRVEFFQGYFKVSEA